MSTTSPRHVRPEPDSVDAAVSTTGTGGGGWVRAAVWLPGLAVAIGAAVATAHGLYEVAAAATVPTVIAWLYPLITDGLALVAYTATARLAGSARRYAWGVVVLAAGLSGLAQASYLASADTSPAPTVSGGPAAFEVSAALRFGIGAWPAIAAAVVAHLLYLLAESARPEHDRARGVPPHAAVAVASREKAVADNAGPQSEPAVPVTEPLAVVREAVAVEQVGAPVYALAAGQRSTAGVHSALFNTAVVQVDALNSRPVEQAAEGAPSVQPDPGPGPSAGPVSDAAEPSRPRVLESPARDRAHSVASAHLARRGALPTVSELEAAAQVSRGTAAAVLKALRTHTDTDHSPNNARSTTETERQN